MRLETDRLIIREFREEDLDELAPILADPKVMEYSLSGPLSRDDAQKSLQHRILDHYEKWGYGLWAIVSKNTKKIIGFSGPVQQKVDDEECIEIGYRIASSEWGNGYASEAMEAIRDYTFFHLDLDKVIAIIEPSNVRSVRVAEKAGFKLSRTTTFHGFNVGVYEISRITVVPYSEKWEEQFESEKEKLEKVFENFPVVFHHIGSTSRETPLKSWPLLSCSSPNKPVTAMTAKSEQSIEILRIVNHPGFYQDTFISSDKEPLKND